MIRSAYMMYKRLQLTFGCWTETWVRKAYVSEL